MRTDAFNLRYQFRLFLRKMVRMLFLPVLARNKVLRNIHAGESCYLICDGVSLKYYDLSKFGEFKAIVSAAVPLHKDFHFLDSRYYALPEPFLYWPAIKKGRFASLAARKSLQQIYSPFRLKPLGISSILSLTNLPFTLNSKSFYFMGDFCDKELPDHFVTKELDGFSGTLNTMISYAIYMGFTRAYLIGCDYTHMPAMSGHWYEKGVGVETDMSTYLEEFLTRAGEQIQLIAVTPDATSKGLHLEHISYLELTGSPAKFRENYELMAEEYLQVLGMQSQYNV